MATNSGPGETPPADGDRSPSIPAMPSVPPSLMYRDAPYLLADDFRHSIGWLDSRKTGPSFVVTTRKLGGLRTTVQRFPLSEQGWTGAWQALNRLDPSAAEATGRKLARLEAGDRAAQARAALDAQSLCNLRNVAFDGGSSSGPLTTGHRYDVRFQDDRIMVCIPSTAPALVELPYADVEAVEVTGTANQTTGVALGLISGLGLLGALLGFVFFRLAGLLLGAVVLGLVGGLIAAGTTKNYTIVRVRGRGTELQFLDIVQRPDDVRRALSEPLMTIRQANAGAAERSINSGEAVTGSVADQLGRLASLLQQDLITRDEFEQLKARTIAQS